MRVLTIRVLQAERRDEGRVLYSSRTNGREMRLCGSHRLRSQMPAAGDDVFTTSSWPWSVIGPACGLGPPGRTLAAPDARLPPTSFLPHDLRTQKTQIARRMTPTGMPTAMPTTAPVDCEHATGGR